MKNKKTLHLIAFSLAVLFLATSLPMITIAETAATAANAEQALLAEIDAMLAEDREPGEIVISMIDDLSREQAMSVFEDIGLSSSCVSVEGYRADESDNYWFEIVVAESQMRQTLFDLSCHGYVASAIPNFIATMNSIEIESATNDELSNADEQAAASVTLDSYDPLTTSWAMDKMGVATAWSYGLRGDESIVIAVADTGYVPHTDINCVDTRMVANVTTYDSDTQTFGTDITDESGHGTFIVGLIGASLNASGSNGVCKSITIVPIKISVYNEEVNKHRSNATYMQQAFKHAKSIGADIINLSFTISSEDGYNEIVSSGYNGLVVTSAGNEGVDLINSEKNRGKISVGSNWIVVGNSDENDNPNENSNYSSAYVHLFAPGTSLKGINNSGTGLRSATWSGTSFSAPHVAAAAAMLMWYVPHYTPVQIKQLIMDSVTPVEALSDKCVSGGRLSLTGIVDALFALDRPAYCLGDPNGSGTINTADYFLLKRTLLGTYEATDQQIATMDVNKDGRVNIADYVLLKRHVLHTFCIPVM